MTFSWDSLSVVASSANSRIKAAIKLRSRRSRNKERLFLVEGCRELLRYLEVLEKGESVFSPPKRMFFAPDLFVDNHEADMLNRFASFGCEMVCVSPALFSQHLSYRDDSDGLLAIVPIPNICLKHDAKIKSMTRLAVIDRVEKPGNLGAILRSADAAGIDAVLLSDPVTDPWNSNVVRSSMGTLFAMPLFEATAETVIAFLQKNSIQILVTSPESGISVHQVQWNLPTAIVLGSEQLGLRDIWFNHAHERISLPMLGKADSLNVSSAAAVFFFTPLLIS